MRPLAALLLFTLPVIAADVDLKPVYLQPTPHRVLLDAKGKAWFAGDDGVRDAANTLLCRPADGLPVRFDAAGRLWWRSPYEDGLSYYDGKGWHHTKLHTDAVHEDAGGRVFAFAGEQVGDDTLRNTLHVFDGSTWAAERLPDRKIAHGRIQAFPRFATHPDGRTWFWLYLYGEWGLKEPAAWSFDGKKWTAHTLTGRKEGEAVDAILPLADDWYMVVVSHPQKGKYNYRAFAWSPTRTADEPLAVDSGYAGSEGGRLHFGGGLVVTPKRELRQATAEEEANLKAAAVARRPKEVFGDPDTPPPVLPFQTRDVIGPDADGRYYLSRADQSPNYTQTWVLWPKHEKADQFVRPTAYPKVNDRPAVFTELFTDAAGTGFGWRADRPDAVLVWDGKAEKWADTPIAPLPRAKGVEDRGAHVPPPVPPQLIWANLRGVGHACGTDGLSLFVRVKTKYAPEKDGGEPAGGIPLQWGAGGGGFGGEGKKESDAPKLDPTAPFYVYEAWLHAGGKWSDTYPPADLIKAKRKDLLTSFAVPATPFGPLPLIAHAGRLWFAQDWKVFGIDADGVTKSADIPKPEAKADAPRGPTTPPLMRAAFAKRDERSLVLAVAGEKESKVYSVKFRPGKLGGVEVSALDPLPFPALALHAAPDGSVLAWPTVWGRFDHPDRIYRLADTKWEPIPDTGRVLAVAADGVVWSRRDDPKGEDPDRRKGHTVLLRVGGAKAERFAWAPEEVAVGFGKPADGAAVFPLPELGVACLEPTKPGEKPVLRVRYAEWREGGLGPMVTTAGGHLLLAGEWAKLFDPKGK